MIITGVIFMYFNDASLQEWNKPSSQQQQEMLKNYDEIKQKENELNLIFTNSAIATKKEDEENEKEM